MRLPQYDVPSIQRERLQGIVIMIVGLTGGIGSGKSSVAKLFRDLQVVVIEADQIARDIVNIDKPAFHEIVKHFGEKILQADKSLNRAKLRSIIFESVAEREWLEKLLHPLIKEEIKQKTANIPKGKYVIIEIPLLLETNFHTMVDRILVVDCFETQQIERVRLRDGSSAETVKSIIQSQVSRTQRLAAAHDIITNDSSQEELKQKVKNLHLYYLELAKL